MKKKFLNMRRRENLAGYLFMLPWLAGFLLFFLYPLVYSLQLAFGNVIDKRTFEITFAGLDNFRTVLTSDTGFVTRLTDTLIESLPDAVLVVVFSLFIAILLNRKMPGRAFFRLAFLLPVIIGTGAVMTALQGNNAYAGGSGGGIGAAVTETTTTFKDMVFDQQLTAVLGPLGEPMAAIVNRVSSVMWLSGIQIIIFTGALQTIPEQLYEAAYCDGATEWEKFWKITLPLTTPNIALNLIYTIIDYFSNANNEVVTYISELFNTELQFSYASALAWLYFAIMGIIIALIMIFMKRRTFYMG